ncbi:hypothetical protein Tco_1122911 [Tanacetum coccineum]|uniref:Uncharacterized protein n=1 Tax=Tanacetum coccineum TaxID=301880 RepID=A0ABQ5J2E8_9ASTR
MVWRHPNAAIDDPRPAASSFNMADVRLLSAHVIKLRDMPEGVLVLSGLSHVWKSRVCDQVLWGADGNVMGIHDFLCLPEWTGVEVQEEPYLDVRPTLQRLLFNLHSSDLRRMLCYLILLQRILPLVNNKFSSNGNIALRVQLSWKNIYGKQYYHGEQLNASLMMSPWKGCYTPSSKIVSKAEASQKRKASTSGATSSHVAKRTRSALAKSYGSTTCPSLFVGDDDESDC